MFLFRVFVHLQHVGKLSPHPIGASPNLESMFTTCVNGLSGGNIPPPHPDPYQLSLKNIQFNKLFRSKVQDPGSWIQDPDSRILDPGSWTAIHDPGESWVQDRRSRILDWTQDPGSRVQKPTLGSKQFIKLFSFQVEVRGGRGGTFLPDSASNSTGSAD